MSTKTLSIPAPRSRNWLTVDEFCEDIGIARSTFADWRAKGRGPKCAKLPSGRLRIRLSEAERFMASLEDAS
ncbi:AlpA family transcriptional regulator [Nocardiopsis sp. MG754419]|uniref:helix-turn-helix transcriptional regulator n=1 Tax=Nocardiopsis sp. MG754419 TaxID=2259865 RepID=UPI001BADB06C|nr:helix-turn-helix domain-containing protein [Nocardiopsis sp. MG754419]MBR8744995.1 DNA-binding protein [Nocardiopsis sp. MG754419]